MCAMQVSLGLLLQHFNPGNHVHLHPLNLLLQIERIKLRHLH